MRNSDTWRSDHLLKRGFVGFCLICMVASSIQFIPVQYIKSNQFSINNVAMTIEFFGAYIIMLNFAVYAYRRYGNGNLFKVLSLKDYQLTAFATVMAFLIAQAYIFMFDIFFQNRFQIEAIHFSKDLYNNTWSLSLLIIGFVFLSPILEELVFRAYILDVAFSDKWRWVGEIISAFFYGLFHMRYHNLFSFIFFAQYGFWMAWLYNQTRNVRAAILMHMVLNAVTISIVGYYYYH
ncbi:CPBP family intramembrane glutamic endopeptidase [Apilactobacillus nanyangensis]|uniref:CPBP family intramembrane metalloprotease n=1 Tax=Apilactobacillus nanyangensis TaxID=2799579 RepID=A0ABT0HYC0_9LACO|nr:CPBP family intramembrane glutamic endopeptidase [Apilactobacillus nanyangensis]MCK8611917.1 CPBP family intramembrane metalloprotease [Apilactobacillus nanyangensis]